MIEGKVSQVLLNLLFCMRTIASTGKINDENKLTEHEIQIIKDRLNKLGYL